MINEQNPKLRKKAVKLITWVHFLIMGLFILGVYFKVAEATYTFIAWEWAGLLAAIKAFTSDSDSPLSKSEKELANKVDLATCIVLLTCSAWWTLLAFIGSWVLVTFRKEKGVANV